VVAAAWAVAVAAELAGRSEGLHHHALVEDGRPPWATAAVFLIGWQLMLAAMMLPSSLPFIRLFARTAASQPHPALVRGAFLGAYALVWSAFGLLAFGGDVLLHGSIERWHWLEHRPWLIGGGALLLAGAFQFTGLKDRCLTECRHPGAYLLRHYRRGVGRAFRIGAGHGLFCLGCCWALMLLMFAAGLANLVWMAALGAVMIYEKTGRAGDRMAQPVGFVLIGLGIVVLSNPGWMPGLFAPR
jgi:predicted metal-binding membrane protein